MWYSRDLIEDEQIWRAFVTYGLLFLLMQEDYGGAADKRLPLLHNKVTG
jgi:hypothetical protein